MKKRSQKFIDKLRQVELEKKKTNFKPLNDEKAVMKSIELVICDVVNDPWKREELKKKLVQSKCFDCKDVGHLNHDCPVKYAIKLKLQE